MSVAHDDDVGLMQAESRLQGINDARSLQAPVRVKDETLCQRLIDKSAARPLVVLSRQDAVGKAAGVQPLGTRRSPILPSLVVARGMCEAVAIGFTFIQGRAINDKDTS